MHVHSARKSSAIHHARLPTATKPLHPRALDRPIRRFTTQPVIARHERPEQSQPRPTLVSQQRMQLRNILEPRILHASACQLRRDLCYGVSPHLPAPIKPTLPYDRELTVSFPSAIYSIYFIYTLPSLIPTQQERSQRADGIEMKKLSEYQPDTLTREEQRDMNRQIFLNLPKTPTTPWGRDASNPMTPRTVAFTQLNGGNSASAAGKDVEAQASSGQGPSRLLPFRQRYGDGPDGS